MEKERENAEKNFNLNGTLFKTSVAPPNHSIYSNKQCSLEVGPYSRSVALCYHLHFLTR